MQKKKLYEKLIKAMKITIAQMFLAICFMSIGYAHTARAQGDLNQRIYLQSQGESLSKVLKQIEKQTNIRFVFSSKLIQSNQKVNATFAGDSLSAVLNNLLQPRQLAYKVVDKVIILKKIENSKTSVSSSLPPTPVEKKEYTPPAFIVTGTVTDDKNEPLVGASVVFEGTQKGTITDVNGSYKLELSDADRNGQLIFSFVGYTMQKVAIEGRTAINVILSEGSALDEVVVTGVFDKRTRMESSVAISVLSSKLMERLAPFSAADLLKNIPGVFVNSSLGEIRNTVYSRGVSAGSNDAATGYFYVSMQEDGLPVTNATFGNYGPDFFLRPDATLGRLEAVRGGTASILGNNAPGGIFNYVSKTGGTTFAGELRAKFGLEGDGKNPYYRMDANFGGPLSSDKSLTYNIGGFLRQANGARYPGYPMNNGGQLKANIVKTYKSGTVKVYAKYLNDKNASFEFLPTVGFDKPTLVTGFEQTNSALIPPVQSKFLINQTGEERTFDSRDKIHSKDLAIGLNFDHKIGEGWTIDNKLRYSDKSSIWNTTAVAYPFDVSGLIWYAITGQLGQFGNYSFKDLASGKELANVTQAPNFINGNFAGFNFIVNKDQLPGASAQKTSLLFNPLYYQSNDSREFIDQLSITKKLNNMSFTAGLYYAKSKIDRTFSVDVGTMFTQITSPRPTPTDITYTDFGGKTFKLTNSEGIFAGADGKSAAVSLYDLTQNQTALFFGHNWAITPALNFDWGIRYENIGVKGENEVASVAPSTKKGGIDGDTTTIYDNTIGQITAKYAYDKRISTVSFSGGLNYKFSDNFAIFGRYSQGSKAPDLDIFMFVNTDATAKFLNLIAQKTQQIEVGLKAKTGNLNLFVTPFFSILGNVATSQLGQETAAISTTYNTPLLYNKFTTAGVEIEGVYNINKNFSFRAVGTFQNSTATDYNTWDVGANGAADDKIVSYSGNETDNNARAMLRLSPTYSNDKLFVSLDWSYMGARQANVPNAFRLPAFTQTNLNLGYNVTSKLGLQVNINNVLNQNGVMSWSAPGGFPAALNRQGFTEANLKANPNVVYSTISLPPRAYFLTVSYKF